jgi:hypothetical protein
MKPVCRNIQNNDAYEYLGENKFKNIRTGNEGVVSDEAARKVFRFNVEATQMINDFPIIEEMIKVLNLKFDNTLKNEK